MELVLQEEDRVYSVILSILLFTSYIFCFYFFYLFFLFISFIIGTTGSPVKGRKSWTREQRRATGHTSEQYPGMDGGAWGFQKSKEKKEKEEYELLLDWSKRRVGLPMAAQRRAVCLLPFHFVFLFHSLDFGWSVVSALFGLSFFIFSFSISISFLLLPLVICLFVLGRLLWYHCFSYRYMFYWEVKGVGGSSRHNKYHTTPTTTTTNACSLYRSPSFSVSLRLDSTRCLNTRAADIHSQSRGAETTNVRTLAKKETLIKHHKTDRKSVV